MDIWHASQIIEIDDIKWYKFECNLINAMRSIDEDDDLNECMRLIIHNELCKQKIFVNMSEKLATLAYFAYVALFGEKIVEPLTQQIEIMLEIDDYEWLIEKQKHVYKFLEDWDDCGE